MPELHFPVACFPLSPLQPWLLHFAERLPEKDTYSEPAHLKEEKARRMERLLKNSTHPYERF